MMALFKKSREHDRSYEIFISVHGFRLFDVRFPFRIRVIQTWRMNVFPPFRNILEYQMLLIVDREVAGGSFWP